MVNLVSLKHLGEFCSVFVNEQILQNMWELSVTAQRIIMKLGSKMWISVIRWRNILRSHAFCTRLQWKSVEKVKHKMRKNLLQENKCWQQASTTQEKRESWQCCKRSAQIWFEDTYSWRRVEKLKKVAK